MNINLRLQPWVKSIGPTVRLTVSTVSIVEAAEAAAWVCECAVLLFPRLKSWVVHQRSRTCVSVPDTVDERFRWSITRQEELGREFTQEQVEWLESESASSVWEGIGKGAERLQCAGRMHAEF